MKLRNLVWNTLLLMLLCGCATPSGQATLSSHPDTIIPDTAPPSQIASATRLFPSVMPAPTDTVTPSPSSTPKNTFPVELPESIQQNCLDILPNLPTDKTYSGKIIFFEKDYEEASFYDLNTRQTLSMQYKPLGITISPDHKKYVIRDAEDHQLKVFAVDGNLLNTIDPEEDSFATDRWLDNDQLVLMLAKPMEGTTYYYYPWDALIINLSTNQRRLIQSDYPDIDRANARMSWEGGGTTKYDPTLTRVVYASPVEEDYIGSGGPGYVLWDMTNQKKLVEVAADNFACTPKWFPDGSKFVINGSGGDFFIISRDGKVTQITDFNDDPQRANQKFYYSDIYAWSPDGRYLVFWLEFIENQRVVGTLATLDTVTGAATDYCVSIGNIGYNLLPSIYVPIWSPDGKNVVVIANRQEDRTFDTFLIDFEGGFAAKVGENLIPSDWLDTGE